MNIQITAKQSDIIKAALLHLQNELNAGVDLSYIEKISDIDIDIDSRLIDDCIDRLVGAEIGEDIEQYGAVAISTAHLSLEDVNTLESALSSGMVMQRDTGFFVKLYSDIDDSFNMLDTPVSKSLQTVMQWAHDRGYTMIELDSDAAIVSDLPTYEWTNANKAESVLKNEKLINILKTFGHGFNLEYYCDNCIDIRKNDFPSQLDNLQSIDSYSSVCVHQNIALNLDDYSISATATLNDFNSGDDCDLPVSAELNEAVRADINKTMNDLVDFLRTEQFDFKLKQTPFEWVDTVFENDNDPSMSM